MKDGKARFIDGLGAYYESYGVPRIGGRIIGLLMTSGAPLSSEEIGSSLRVSRASVSTNVRLLLLCGFVEAARRDGRTEYYTIAADAWARAVDARIDGFRRLRALAEQGAAALRGDAEAARKVREMADWADAMMLGHERIRAEWKSRGGPE
jgi:DNA-binding transcriptional regulator GbsR (MarR family)